jgi:hypothetical protein
MPETHPHITEYHMTPNRNPHLCKIPHLLSLFPAMKPIFCTPLGGAVDYRDRLITEDSGSDSDSDSDYGSGSSGIDMALPSTALYCLYLGLSKIMIVFKYDMIILKYYNMITI